MKIDHNVRPGNYKNEDLLEAHRGRLGPSALVTNENEGWLIYLFNYIFLDFFFKAKRWVGGCVGVGGVEVSLGQIDQRRSMHHHHHHCCHQHSI